jgi:uncharacterized protein YgiM (DUF1202 family)
MARWLKVVLALLLLAPTAAFAAHQLREMIIAEPFLELHTGPGRGYPVFQVVDRGEKVKVEAQRTDWFRVVTERGVEGWAPREQMLATLELSGEPANLPSGSLEELAKRRWEGGVMAGDFSGASLITIFGGHRFSDHLSVELTIGHALGEVSDDQFATLGLVHTVAPEWRLSPYFAIGAGAIRTTTLRQVDEGTNQMAYVGLGLRYYLTRRFIARAEYHNDVIFTSRDDNEEIQEWKVGFAFFF